MLRIEESTISCGVEEISGLGGSPKEHIQRVFQNYSDSEEYDYDTDRDRYTWHPPFLLFSDIAGGHGDRLAAEIKKHKLGKVIVSDVKTNPNSNNKICVWIWQVNYPAIVKYCEEPRVRHVAKPKRR